MRIMIFILFSFIVSETFADRISKLNSILEERNLKKLEEYIDKTNSDKIRIEWEIKREVINQYIEAIINIEDLITKDKEGNAGYFMYEIKLLSHDNIIFFYSLNRVKFHDDRFHPYYENISEYYSKEEYLRFEADFQNTYGIPINKNELFLTSIIYGEHCGFVGENPELMKQLGSAIETKNMRILKKWLKSANSETQLYAIRGYKVMEYNGYKLSDEEKNLLTIVQKKEGTVRACSGCLFSNESFQFFISEINQSNPEFLYSKKVNNANKSVVIKKKSYIIYLIGFIAIVLIIVYSKKKEK